MIYPEKGSINGGFFSIFARKNNQNTVPYVREVSC